MAEGSDSGYGGFDVKFLDTCPLERECSICHLAFRDPVQTTCGHIFCKTCITKVISEHPRCPLDNEYINKDEKLFQDFVFLRNFLNPSKIMCSNGCEWTGSYKDFVENDHLSTCGFVITKCPNKDCEETFLKKFLEQHRSECPWEKVKCMYCEDDITRNDKQSHEEEQCIKFPVECTKCLRKEIPRELLKKHIHNECVKTKIGCPYLSSGCDFIVERDMMEAHVEEQVNKHLLLVQKNYDQRITQAYEEIIKLHEEKDKQQKQIVQLTWNLTSFQGYKKSFAHFWEIPEITDKLKTKHELSSDQFYTEPGDSGYRFQLQFNSRSEGVATQSNPFIGLYFHLCSGDHDDALTWPFKHVYTLSIVNQAGKPDKQYTYKPEDNEDCFLKPHEVTLNLGLG